MNTRLGNVDTKDQWIWERGYEKGYSDAMELILSRESIDEQVQETPPEIKVLYDRFLFHDMCHCPICKSLEKGGDCQCGKQLRR
jgi:hypothetical protein